MGLYVGDRQKGENSEKYQNRENGLNTGTDELQ